MDVRSMELVNEKTLLAESGIDRYALRRIRKWLFLEPIRKYPGRGSKTYYPAYAVPMIRRFRELRARTRKIDECVCQLWQEGFPIDIRGWVGARLAEWEKVLATITDVDQLQSGLAEHLLKEPARTDTRYPLKNRLRLREEISQFVWALDLMLGRQPAKSIYDPGSPVFGALKSAAGFKGDWQPPDPELAIEELSAAGLRDVLNSATDEELEQTRRDFAAIAGLIDACNEIDWHLVRKVLNVQRTSSVRPPAPLDFLIASWRNYNVRAGLLLCWIHIRRSSEHSQRASEILALSALALAQLRQHAQKQAEQAR